MLLISGNNYTAFKATFDGLGGNRKTPVVFADHTGVSGTFDIGITFGADAIVMITAQTTVPSTFASDFPQAVACQNVGTGG